MGGKPFRWPAGTYVHSHGFDHIMMAMETEINKDGVHYKELKGTPEEEVVNVPLIVTLPGKKNAGKGNS